MNDRFLRVRLLIVRLGCWVAGVPHIYLDARDDEEIDCGFCGRTIGEAHKDPEKVRFHFRMIQVGELGNPYSNRRHWDICWHCHERMLWLFHEHEGERQNKSSEEATP